MIIGNFLKNKLNSNKIGLLFLASNKKNNFLQKTFIYISLLALLFPNKILAQNTLKTDADDNTSSISEIINKVVGTNDSSEENNQNNKSLSKIISSFIKKDNDPSIMFSDEDVAKIYQALDAHKNNKPFDARPKDEQKKEADTTSRDKSDSYIYLGSILYHSANNWSAWINGKKISNQNNKPTNELYIKSINPDNADIVWIMSISKWKILSNKTSDKDAPINSNNQVELNFNLSFNQTYMLAGGKIIEGKITIPSEVNSDSNLENTSDNNL